MFLSIKNPLLHIVKADFYFNYNYFSKTTTKIEKRLYF